MLIGKKIILEDIYPENIEYLRGWRNDPSIRKYFREWKDISKPRQQEWYSERGNNLNHEHVYFQVMYMDSNIEDEKLRIKERKIAGCCGLHYIDWRLRSAEFGCFLGPEFIGKGMGKESLILLFDFGFKEMNLHKIWCEVYDNNTSAELYRRIGFVDEGILRDNYYHEGCYGNSFVMSILEDEWREKYGNDVMWNTNNVGINQ